MKKNGSKKFMVLINVPLPPWSWTPAQEINWRIWNTSFRLLLNSMEQSPSWEDDGPQLVNKSRDFHVTRRFFAVLTRSRHYTLYWSSWNQFTSSPYFFHIHFISDLPFMPGCSKSSPTFRSWSN